MTARGVRETKTHYFDADTLAGLGAEVDAFLAGDLGGWSITGVEVESDVRMVRDYSGGYMRVSIRYTAAVSLARGVPG